MTISARCISETIANKIKTAGSLKAPCLFIRRDIKLKEEEREYKLPNWVNIRLVFNNGDFRYGLDWNGKIICTGNKVESLVRWFYNLPEVEGDILEEVGV